MDPWKKAQEHVKKMFVSVTRKDFLWKAFTDTYSAQGTIVQDQPSDFWVLDRGTFYTIEVKSCHQTKFYFKDIRPSQLIAARRVPAAGGISIFLIVKLPEWQWHMLNGLTIFNLKQDGEAGVTWNNMHNIVLNWEAISERYKPK
jgi:penicillin-binding protein-related factor A (putative recombinase)